MDDKSAKAHQQGIPLGVVRDNAQQTATVVAAITSTAPSAGYVQAEATALRADVVALRATVAALVAELQSVGLVP